MYGDFSSMIDQLESTGQLLKKIDSAIWKYCQEKSNDSSKILPVGIIANSEKLISIALEGYFQLDDDRKPKNPDCFSRVNNKIYSITCSPLLVSLATFKKMNYLEYDKDGLIIVCDQVECSAIENIDYLQDFFAELLGQKKADVIYERDPTVTAEYWSSLASGDKKREWMDNINRKFSLLSDNRSVKFSEGDDE